MFDLSLISAVTGMQPAFIHKVLSRTCKQGVSLAEVLLLLQQDAYAETFIPRSRIPEFLLTKSKLASPEALRLTDRHTLIAGNTLALVERVACQSVNCVVTSSPYWGTRRYDAHCDVSWADGEVCAFGHEQTPEGFIRHTIQLLHSLKRTLTTDGSIWWNIMDTHNTRTRIRTSTAETLRAMQGKDLRKWTEYDCRRYSSGHSFLKDGDLCLIPSRIAERASRIGYHVKRIITWKKTGGTIPESVKSRVGRELEYIIHLSLSRSPYMDKKGFQQLPQSLGGRNPDYEEDKITDVWSLPTANGINGHGASFPIELPARCIALSSRMNDLIFDPFIGSGTTSIASHRLDRRSLGFDASNQYILSAKERLDRELARNG